MFDFKDIIKAKIELLDKILRQMEEGRDLSIFDILQEEMSSLKSITDSYVEDRESKSVVKKEEGVHKTRFYLKDGSTYVISRKPDKNYKYLFDIRTKRVTYEFENGQVEHTFDNGIKEIRMGDGRIYIKTGANQYECINNTKENMHNKS